ncbi:MAG: proteasome lid subunit RPN8/RPN11 [Candidatus Azotimanducaceae bacterium]|jgi:proteasome lid subunit RPN8/RPN11
MFARMECTEAAEATLLRAAQAAAPREIAAVLGGCVVGATAQVRRVLMLPNEAVDDQASFAVDGVAFTQCEHELRRGGDTFLGFAHSHPHGSTAPSIRDREQLWTECVQVITDGTTWQAFVLDEHRSAHPLAAMPNTVHQEVHHEVHHEVSTHPVGTNDLEQRS